MASLLAVDKGGWMVLDPSAVTEFWHFPSSNQRQRPVAVILVCSVTDVELEGFQILPVPNQLLKSFEILI